MVFYRSIYHCLRVFHDARCWFVNQLTPMGLGVFVVMLISGLIGLGSSQSMCHLIFFLSVSLLGLAMIGRGFIQYSFKVDRTLPRFGTVGEPLQYRLVLKNLTHQPQAGLMMVEIIPHEFPCFGEFWQIRECYSMGRAWWREWCQYLVRRRWAIAPLKELPVLAAGLKTEVAGEILPLRRGRLCLDALMVVCPEPLGLSYKRVSDRQPQSICILPKRYQLPPLYLTNSRSYQMGDAVLTSSVGEALEFRSLRDYRPGDPTNKIHWKSWAKVGRPIVKEQQDESVVHHALILDTFQPTLYSDAFEEMLSIATSILTQERAEFTALLDVIFAAQDVQYLTVGQGLRQRAELLEVIATMTPCHTLSFNDLIPLVQSRLSRLSSCVCLFLSWDDARLECLKMLSQFNVPTKAIVVCESQLEYVGLRYLTISPHCTVHFISSDQIQEGLLQL